MIHHGIACFVTGCLMALGALLNLGDAYSPKEKHKTADEVRRFAVVAFVLQGAFAVWVLLS